MSFSTVALVPSTTAPGERFEAEQPLCVPRSSQMPLHGMAVRRSLQERGNVFTEHTFAFSLPGFSYSVVVWGGFFLLLLVAHFIES